MKRTNRVIIILLASIALTGCAEKQEVKEPTPITVEKKDRQCHNVWMRCWAAKSA